MTKKSPGKTDKPDLYEYLGQLKIWTLPLISLLVILGLTFLILKPRLQMISSGRAERRRQREKLKVISKKIETLQDLDVKSFQENLLILSEALPNEPSLPSFLVALDRLAEQTGLLIENVTFQGRAKQKKARGAENVPLKTTVSVTTRGKSEQVSVFLKQLEGLRRLVSIEKIEAGRSQAEGSISATLSSSVKLTIFFSPLPDSLGEPEEPLGTFTSADNDLITRLRNRLSASAFKSFAGPAATGSGNPFMP
jgi:Tfp pilus assembly protein PilO